MATTRMLSSRRVFLQLKDCLGHSSAGPETLLARLREALAGESEWDALPAGVELVEALDEYSLRKLAGIEEGTRLFRVPPPGAFASAVVPDSVAGSCRVFLDQGLSSSSQRELLLHAVGHLLLGHVGIGEPYGHWDDATVLRDPARRWDREVHDLWQAVRGTPAQPAEETEIRPLPFEDGVVLRGPLLEQPLRVATVRWAGEFLYVAGEGLDNHRFLELRLAESDLSKLQVEGVKPTFQGDPELFKLGIESIRMGMAHEYDPNLSLSLSRVDPLPHQLEAVYEYMLKLPRIRFLLADDPGAGKTIMAGMLLKELKARGLVKRILIVVPAKLVPQWRAELEEKFQEEFTVVAREQLRAAKGKNPWQVQEQVIASHHWARRKDIRDTLEGATWDLIFVDEAHHLRGRQAYKLGELLSARTEHLVFLTATPHTGDADEFRRFLALLDPDVFADKDTLEKALANRSAPLLLRRRKEDLCTFPDEDGLVHPLFVGRDVRTVPFELGGDEHPLYEDLSNYVREQISLSDDTDRAHATGFVMTLYQRRFASSLFALTESLKRRRDKLQVALKKAQRLPTRLNEQDLADFDELGDEDAQQVADAAEDASISVDRGEVRRELGKLDKLIDKAQTILDGQGERKLAKLRTLLKEQGVFADRNLKLIVFTEHRDTLNYLVRALRAWGLSVVEIHGQMRLGNSKQTGTRLHAQAEFRGPAQVLVATEAAGEGINLQFCWLMINYDLPWNPARLEQRMGRIHRIGQKRDPVVILNFLATNTIEGRVQDSLVNRLAGIERDLKGKCGSGQVFNVVGQFLPQGELEAFLRDVYAGKRTEADLIDHVKKRVDPERFQRLLNSSIAQSLVRSVRTLEMHERNADYQDMRLVPEASQAYLLKAAETVGLLPKQKRGNGVWSLGKLPRSVLQEAKRLFSLEIEESQPRVVFDQEALSTAPGATWLVPTAPLFETLRHMAFARCRASLQQGTVFFGLEPEPHLVEIYRASIVDGLGDAVAKRLVAVRVTREGMSVAPRDWLLDVVASDATRPLPARSEFPNSHAVEHFVVSGPLQGVLDSIGSSRLTEMAEVERHLITSIKGRMFDLEEKLIVGGLDDVAARRAEEESQELESRLQLRTQALRQQRQLRLAELRLASTALVLPAPDVPRQASVEEQRHAIEQFKRFALRMGRAPADVSRDGRGVDVLTQDKRDRRAYCFVRGWAPGKPVFLPESAFLLASRLGRRAHLCLVHIAGVLEIPDPARSLKFERLPALPLHRAQPPSLQP